MSPQQAAEFVESLYSTWYSTLVRYACRACGSLELAEDMAQESMFHLFKALSAGQQIEFPKAWALCVLRREVSRYRAAGGGSGWREESLDDLAGEIPCVPDDPNAALVLGEVYKRFSVLTHREEEVLMLRLDGMKYREIARELQLSVPSVGTLLARALRKLQLAMGRQTTENPSGLLDIHDAL